MFQLLKRTDLLAIIRLFLWLRTQMLLQTQGKSRLVDSCTCCFFADSGNVIGGLRNRPSYSLAAKVTYDYNVAPDLALYHTAWLTVGTGPDDVPLSFSFLESWGLFVASMCMLFLNAIYNCWPKRNGVCQLFFAWISLTVIQPECCGVQLSLAACLLVPPLFLCIL